MRASRSKTLTLDKLTDYVSCPLKYKYRHVAMAEGVIKDSREAYAMAIKKVVQDYVECITIKGGTYNWERMATAWEVEWSNYKGIISDLNFVQHLYSGYTACRHFFDMDEDSSDKDRYAGQSIPFTIPMGDFTISDTVDIMRIKNYKSRNSKVVQLISMHPGYLGWSIRDRSLSVVMMGYRLAMANASRFFGQSKIDGYEYVWFDSVNATFLQCDAEDVPEKYYSSARAYLSAIARGAKNEVFYPRFDESVCSRCRYNDSCSIEHAIPSKLVSEIYDVVDKRNKLK